MTFTTANLCDDYSGEDYFQIAEPAFISYGANPVFSGQITTLKTFEDNALVRSVLEEKVQNRVLVIDSGGSHRCALVDNNLAMLAIAGYQLKTGQEILTNTVIPEGMSVSSAMDGNLPHDLGLVPNHSFTSV